MPAQEKFCLPVSLIPSHCIEDYAITAFGRGEWINCHLLSIFDSSQCHRSLADMGRFLKMFGSYHGNTSKIIFIPLWPHTVYLSQVNLQPFFSADFQDFSIQMWTEHLRGSLEARRFWEHLPQISWNFRKEKKCFLAWVCNISPQKAACRTQSLPKQVPRPRASQIESRWNQSKWVSSNSTSCWADFFINWNIIVLTLRSLMDKPKWIRYELATWQAGDDLAVVNDLVSAFRETRLRWWLEKSQRSSWRYLFSEPVRGSQNQSKQSKTNTGKSC